MTLATKKKTPQSSTDKLAKRMALPNWSTACEKMKCHLCRLESCQHPCHTAEFQKSTDKLQ
jgi:hypothetical protein